MEYGQNLNLRVESLKRHPPESQIFQIFVALYKFRFLSKRGDLNIFSRSRRNICCSMHFHGIYSLFNINVDKTVSTNTQTIISTMKGTGVHYNVNFGDLIINDLRFALHVRERLTNTQSQKTTRDTGLIRVTRLFIFR